jgi:hypothetical protein
LDEVGNGVAGGAAIDSRRLSGLLGEVFDALAKVTHVEGVFGIELNGDRAQLKLKSRGRIVKGDPKTSGKLHIVLVRVLVRRSTRNGPAVRTHIRNSGAGVAFRENDEKTGVQISVVPRDACDPPACLLF